MQWLYENARALFSCCCCYTTNRMAFSSKTEVHTKCEAIPIHTARMYTKSKLKRQFGEEFCSCASYVWVFVYECNAARIIILHTNHIYFNIAKQVCPLRLCVYVLCVYLSSSALLGYSTEMDLVGVLPESKWKVCVVCARYARETAQAMTTAWMVYNEM